MSVSCLNKMPIYRKTIKHYNFPGHAHFLTFSCFKGLPLLNKECPRSWFVKALTEAKEKYKFALWAYVIMPEHAHLIVFPRLETYNIAIFLKAIKQSVARKAKHYLNENNKKWVNKLTVRREKRMVFRFWQTGPGYDRNIYDEKELLKKINYIHNNPVKRGLVLTPQEWEWSSIKWYDGEKDVKLSIDDYAVCCSKVLT